MIFLPMASPIPLIAKSSLEDNSATGWVSLSNVKAALAALEKIDPNTSRAIQKQLRDAGKAQMQQQAQQLPPEAMQSQPAGPMPA